MNEQECLNKMVAPSQRRPKVRYGGVLQIWVTRKCDKACFACTQGSNLKQRIPDITVEQFEQACISLQDYFGVVGMFGGNPCTHPQFAELCEVMRRYIPFERCGLWANKLFGKGAIARQTFNPAISNLNVHLDKAAFDEFRRTWPEARPFGLNSDSRHSPPYVAMQDVIEDESKRWELISNCDINQNWSAMIGVFRGELRAWFCEIAGAQAMLHQHEEDYPDTGHKVVPGWWEKPMQDFANQVYVHCHACGVPLRAYGELSQSKTGVERVSKTHQEVYQPKTSHRQVVLIESFKQTQSGTLDKFTDYVGNGLK